MIIRFESYENGFLCQCYFRYDRGLQDRYCQSLHLAGNCENCSVGFGFKAEKVSFFTCNLLFQVRMLSQSPEVSLYDLSSLKVLVTGSSLLSSTIRVEVMDRIPSLRYVRESYGLNECGLVTLTYPRDAKKSSASSSSAGGELKNNRTNFLHIHDT